MFQQWLNGKSLLFLIAAAIVAGTIWYSGYLEKKIEVDEKQRMDIWVEAQRTLITADDNASLNLASKISSENKDIPIIETDENDIITNNFLNIDSNKVAADTNFLKNKLQEFRLQHTPIEIVISEKPYTANKYYYGETRLQTEVKYYPIVQLIIAGIFLLITIIAQRTSYVSTQNQLWAGMAKETAHQLGTPVTSLKGWAEVLKEIPGNDKISGEIEKDISRLELISDRFGKIGSQPKLEETNIVLQINEMVAYIKKRAGARVDFSINTNGEHDITALISPPLFDWVIENLLKNALDAMDETGKINIYIKDEVAKVLIEISDTGKGISKQHIFKIFNPGFTTKKRGWGLGLTLSKRIIEQYHKGHIFIKSSELGIGTTFCIELFK